ncbi:MAG TPA: tetratricopeptide repeat protein [Pyrinomonadaceae bacterium]|jgi:tetratricopeptide (TPR) repeat protein
MSKSSESVKIPASPAASARQWLYGPVIAASLLVCFWGAWSAGRAGLSRLLSKYGSISSQLVATDKAVLLASSDAEAHYARATVLASLGRFQEALQSYREAVALRPRDYVLWMEMGQVYDQMGDAESALVAFKEAARLAPYYAQSRWQAGNLLLRAGRLDEAFTELRRAASSDPSLFNSTVDLAWNSFRGDVRRVEQAVAPQTAVERLALARFLLAHQEINEAVQLFHHVGAITETDRQVFVQDLLGAKRFNEAYEVWLDGHNELKEASIPGIINTGFEDDIRREDYGFGWQLRLDAPNTTISPDLDNPYEGKRSLRIDFKGDLNPSISIVSQLLLVKPNTHYRLSFAARTQDVVTGGLPILTVLDADDQQQTLAQTKPLPQGTSRWETYDVEFATTARTTAVTLALQRQSCGTQPCPIFGHLWLDDFAVQQ